MSNYMGPHDAHAARLSCRRLDHGGAIASNPSGKHRAARSTMSSTNTSTGLHQTSASTSTRQVPQRTAWTEPEAPGAEGGHTRGKNPFWADLCEQHVLCSLSCDLIYNVKYIFCFQIHNWRVFDITQLFELIQACSIHQLMLIFAISIWKFLRAPNIHDMMQFMNNILTFHSMFTFIYCILDVLR